jgi:hypothetical protein
VSDSVVVFALQLLLLVLSLGLFFGLLDDVFGRVSISSLIIILVGIIF